MAASSPGGSGGVAVGFRSKDGLALEQPAIRLLDHIRQPDALLLAKATPSRNGPDAGTLICYAVKVAGAEGAGTGVGGGGGGLVRCLSLDQGRSWGQPEAVVINGWPKDLVEFDPVGPAAVQLDDGRVRVYFAAAKPGVTAIPPPTRPDLVPPGRGTDPRDARPMVSSPGSRIYSAISNDGLRFAFEDGHRFELAGISDPEVVRLPVNRSDDGDTRRIDPWLLFFTREDSTYLATSRDGLTFTRDETFVVSSVRHSGAMTTASDSRQVRLYGRDSTGIVSIVFDPATGETKPDGGARDRGEADDPSASPTGDGATLLVFVRKTADKPEAPDLPLRPPTGPDPKRPLDPRFPPTHPSAPGPKE